MVIMMEECGELIQACSKALRREDFYDNKELDTKIAKIDSERNNGNKRFPKKKSQKTNF